MKRLLLVLGVLGFIVPASADVLVYKINESIKGIETDYESEEGGYKQFTQTKAGYVVFETVSSGEQTELWVVWTGKAKIEVDQDDEGNPIYKTVKAAWQESLGYVNYSEIELTKNTMWIMCSSGGPSIWLLGTVKPVKINGISTSVAKTLTGYITEEWDEDSGYAGLITISLDSKMTAAVAERFDSDDCGGVDNCVQVKLMDILSESGYELNP